MISHVNNCLPYLIVMMVSISVYATEVPPTSLTKFVSKIRTVIKSDKCEKGFFVYISRLQGLTYFKNGEMGETSTEANWRVAKADLVKPANSIINKICKPFNDAREYIAKDLKPQIVLENNKWEILWRIYEGHHAGNYRGFSATLSLEDTEWKLTSISFPNDYTP